MQDVRDNVIKGVRCHLKKNTLVGLKKYVAKGPFMAEVYLDGLFFFDLIESRIHSRQAVLKFEIKLVNFLPKI